MQSVKTVQWKEHQALHDLCIPSQAAAPTLSRALLGKQDGTCHHQLLQQRDVLINTVSGNRGKTYLDSDQHMLHLTIIAVCHKELDSWSMHWPGSKRGFFSCNALYNVSKMYELRKILLLLISMRSKIILFLPPMERSSPTQLRWQRPRQTLTPFLPTVPSLWQLIFCFLME